LERTALPPIETGSALDLLVLLGEGDALVRDFLFELCDSRDVLVDRLVNERPKGFGRLRLWTIRRWGFSDWPRHVPALSSEQNGFGIGLIRLRAQRFEAAPRKIPSTHRWKRTRTFSRDTNEFAAPTGRSIARLARGPKYTMSWRGFSNRVKLPTSTTRMSICDGSQG
jgi:hypothetical protein